NRSAPARLLLRSGRLVVRKYLSRWICTILLARGNDAPQPPRGGISPERRMSRREAPRKSPAEPDGPGVRLAPRMPSPRERRFVLALWLRARECSRRRCSLTTQWS